MKKILFLIILISTMDTFSFGQVIDVSLKHEESPKELNKQELENLICFTKLYGYIKYFYPSNKSEKFDWEKFAIYGVRRITPSKDNSELISTLNELFIPLCPSLTISASPIIRNLDNYLDKKKRSFIIINMLEVELL